MRASILLGIALSIAVCAAASAAEVNVSRDWCGGDCSEGHDNTACVCTWKSWMSQSDRNAWVSCEELPCCDINATFCDLGYVAQEECEPILVDGPPPSDPITCSTETPRGWGSCEVPCGESGCYVYSGAPHMEIVNEQGAGYCTRPNETADWWNPWSYVEDCTGPNALEAQSPWDDVSWDDVVCN